MAFRFKSENAVEAVTEGDCMWRFTSVDALEEVDDETEHHMQPLLQR